jgi:hypothetical protein
MYDPAPFRMVSDVFISYAAGDEPRAAELAAALETKEWTVWWDRHIPPGRTFDEVIEQALTQARCVVVLWSAESVKSRWVRTEASVAAERGTLVPALIEPVAIPLEFRRLQAADLTSWHGDSADPELQHLIETLGHLIKAGARPHAPPTLKHRSASALIEGRLRLLTALVAAFIAGAGLMYVIVGGDAERARISSEPAAEAMPAGRDAGSASQPTATAGSSERPSAAPTRGRMNLLSPANGGHLMAAPDKSWQHAIDDDGENWQYIQARNGDGVYAFRNEQAATFDTFRMLIADTSDLNVKEFELLAGNESPTGAFESIGTFQTQNIRLYPSPWQEFTFSTVRARYLKVHVISAWGAGWNGSPKVVEWQLLGTL